MTTTAATITTADILRNTDALDCAHRHATDRGDGFCVGLEGQDVAEAIAHEGWEIMWRPYTDCECHIARTAEGRVIAVADISGPWGVDVTHVVLAGAMGSLIARQVDAIAAAYAAGADYGQACGLLDYDAGQAIAYEGWGLIHAPGIEDHYHVALTREGRVMAVGRTWDGPWAVDVTDAVTV